MQELQIDDLPAAPGTYLVWLRVKQPVRIAVGRLGDHALTAALYVYVGSAHGPGGLRARLRRHLRFDKIPHWHIDALTIAVPVVALWVTASSERAECVWARTLAQHPNVIAPIDGFGASDCACATHLFRVPPGQLRALWAALGQPYSVARDPAFNSLA